MIPLMTAMFVPLIEFAEAVAAVLSVEEFIKLPAPTPFEACAVQLNSEFVGPLTPKLIPVVVTAVV